jgi:hypothetical protein
LHYNKELLAYVSILDDFLTRLLTLVLELLATFLYEESFLLLWIRRLFAVLKSDILEVGHLFEVAGQSQHVLPASLGRKRLEVHQPDNFFDSRWLSGYLAEAGQRQQKRSTTHPFDSRGGLRLLLLLVWLLLMILDHK